MEYVATIWDSYLKKEINILKKEKNSGKMDTLIDLD